jgi:hypothetical protein
MILENRKGEVVDSHPLFRVLCASVFVKWVRNRNHEELKHRGTEPTEEDGHNMPTIENRGQR